MLIIIGRLALAVSSLHVIEKKRLAPGCYCITGKRVNMVKRACLCAQASEKRIIAFVKREFVRGY